MIEVYILREISAENITRCAHKLALENKNSLGNGSRKMIPVLTVHWLVLYLEFSHHLYATTASFIFLYHHKFKIKGDWTRGCPTCADSGTMVVHTVWHGPLSSRGVPILSACLCLPQTCVRLDTES